MRRMRRVLAMTLVAASVGMVGASRAHAIDILDAVKLFGIGYAVKVFGKQINGFLNTVLIQKGARFEGKTKVVPIVSVGSGAYVGAAQVMGPEALVDKVKAAAAVDLKAGDVNITGVLPISTSKPLKADLKRVEGVGLSALLDFRL